MYLQEEKLIMFVKIDNMSWYEEHGLELNQNIVFSMA
jgi:hypothetical protein